MIDTHAYPNPQQAEADRNTPGFESEKDRAEIKAYLDRHEKLASQRQNWESHWQECFDHIIPRKADINRTNTPGVKRGNELFDGTAILANTSLAGLLHSMLTNPSLRFFELIMGDPSIDEQEDVKEYLQDCAQKMFTVMNNSNFQTEIHEVYLDLGAIGTSAIYMGEDAEKVIHFSARSMKEIYIDENNLGMIDTVERVFKWKLRQIVQEFGEKVLRPDLLRKYRDGNTDDFEILHCTHPVSDEEYESKGGVFSYKSVYILKEERQKLSTKGYHEFPYCVPRWTKTTGEVYGRGPGMDALSDIKMLNRMKETVIKGAQKTVDPPLMVADDGVIGNVRLTPGGLTIVRPSSEVPIRPLITDARIDFGIQLWDRVELAIRRAFFVDQVQLREGPQMTATEVNQRTEENLRFMGPVLGRQNFELLGPMIERVFGVMARKNMFKEAPPLIRGKNFDVRFSSLVARAQRMSEGQNLTRAISVASPLINADPKAMDIIDADAGVKYVMDIYGVPQKLMRKSRELKQLRDARDKANQQMAQQAQEAHQAEVAGKVMPGVAQLQTASQKQEAPAQ